MDKKKEKQIVEETKKLLQSLLDKGTLTLKELEQLSKLCQKVISQNIKQKAENEKKLQDFISNKPEILDFISKDEGNVNIVTKASQQLLSALSPPKTKKGENELEISQNGKKDDKNKKGKYIIKKESAEKLFVLNKPGDLCVYIENLETPEETCNTKDLVPILTLIYFPEEKSSNVIMKEEEKINVCFSQVDYALDYPIKKCLDIDYKNLFEKAPKEEGKKGRSYLENKLDMKLLESQLKSLKIIEGNKLEIKYAKNDYGLYKALVKEIIKKYEDKIKLLKTNNQIFLNEITI